MHAFHALIACTRSSLSLGSGWCQIAPSGAESSMPNPSRPVRDQWKGVADATECMHCAFVHVIVPINPPDPAVILSPRHACRLPQFDDPIFGRGGHLPGAANLRFRRLVGASF